MTNNIFFRTSLFVTLFFLCSSVLLAQKGGKNRKAKKNTHIEYVTDIQPDPIMRKSRPDRHPSPLEMPALIGHGTVQQLHGIDVSHYQGRINWDVVAQQPNVHYVYIKATEGVKTIDDRYEYNFRECKRVGLKVGSYLFFRPHLSARAQFDLFCSVVDTKSQDLLPLIDAEAIKGVSIPVFQQRLLELCSLFEKEYGVKPLIYTGRNFYNRNIHGNPRLSEYKYFIASYSLDEPELNGNDDYLLWQYSATGRVSGIRGNVDMSRFVGKHHLSEILIK